jgi:hypothetical protein
MRVLAVLLLVAGACRDDHTRDVPAAPPPPPPPAAFGDVIDGMPIVRIGNGHVTAVAVGDDVVLRAVVNGVTSDLERFTPGECPVLDLGETYFVHGDTCGWDLIAFPLPDKRLECDELAWNGGSIFISRRTHVTTAIELPPTCH